MNGAASNKLKPAVIAGVACGAAAAIPPISCLNLCCCALVIGGGFLAVFLSFKETPPAAEPPYGDGAVLGLMTGVIGAFTGTVIGIPIQLITTRMGWQPDISQLEEALDGADIPPQVLEMMEQFMSGGGLGFVAILVSLFISLIVYSIFAMIGALIGVAVLHKKHVGAAPGGYVPPPPPAA